jgi:hypothetical protein
MINELNKISFYVKKAWRDFHDPIQFGVSDRYPGNPSWPYALDYSAGRMIDIYGMGRDKEGIIMMPHYVDHLEKNEDADTHYYSPLKIAHYALGIYNDKLKGRGPDSWSPFFTHVGYLTETYTHFNDNPSQIVWRTPTSVARYGVDENHTSAIVQGLVISALVRAFLVSGDSSYLDLAKRALGILEVPVREGGVRAETPWGVMYEEYPADPYSHVVNGFLFCLIGLFELSAVGGSERAERLFDQGICTLAEVLPTWIDDWWSRYDLRDITNGEIPNYATMHYQYLHRDQLNIAYKITSRDIFNNYCKKLNLQLKSSYRIAIPYTNKFRKLLLNNWV